MFERLSPMLLLPIFLSGCGRTPATEATEQTFTFDSVAYNSGGKAQTSKFVGQTAVIGGKIVELPGLIVALHADAVKNEIVVQGSYGPGELTLTAIKVPVAKDRIVSLSPQSNAGKWSAAIPADTFKANVLYTLKPVVNDRDDDSSSIKIVVGAN